MIASVRESFEGIEKLAREIGGDAARLPFRGSIAGVETAVLDACSRICGMTLGQFLGGRRTEIEVTATTTSAGQDFSHYKDQLITNAKRFPCWRIKGDARTEVNLEYLRELTELNRRKYDMSKLMWIDINEALNQQGALDFLRRVIEEHDAGKIEGKLVIEQPVKKDQYKVLPLLQAFADVNEREKLKIVIMADESLFGLADWRKLAAEGGCGAINIKVPKAGGLLAAMDIVEAALAFNPNIEVYLGGMLATSDIMSDSIISLGQALPRLDYITSGPNFNVKVNIAENRLRFVGATSMIAPQVGLGLGTLPNFPLLAPHVTRTYPEDLDLFGQMSTEEEPGLLTHAYSRPEAIQFKQKPLDSYLLEARGIAYGLPIRRLNPLIFFCDPHNDGSYRLGFWWTGSSLSTKAYNMVCGQKQWTRNFLRAAGVKATAGRQFGADQKKAVPAYAKSIGWPVVIKPADGSGGRAVTTGIRSEADLEYAFKALKPGESFLVEKHLLGEDFRILTTSERVVSVLRRVAVHVIGDGKSTVTELVARANKQRMRNPRYNASLIKLERETAKAQLAKAKLTPESVLPKGRRLELSTAANVSQGGEAVDVTAQTHPSLLEFALAVRRALPELGHIGIDVLMEDHTKPFDEQSVGVCEVNAYGELAMHTFPGATRVDSTEKSAPDLVADIFGFNLRHYGIEPAGERRFLSVRIVCDGVSDVPAYRSWLEHFCEELMVSVDDLVETLGDAGPRLTAVLTGWRDRVAAVTAKAVEPSSGLSAEYVETVAVPTRVSTQGRAGTEDLDVAEPTAVRVVATGKVQKVGFRLWLQEQARARGVRGWVRNRSDGALEAVFDAPPETTAEMLNLLKKGPKGAKVDHIETEPYRGQPRSADFLRYRTIGA